MNSVLFQPFHLRDLTLRNRIVLAPMTRARTGAARLPNRLMADYYAQRSSAGLLITEGVTISEEVNGWSASPGIYTDEMAEGWKLTTDAVHAKGGLIFLQLWHTGRASHSNFHGGRSAVAPSAIKISDGEIHTPNGKQPHEVPRALETTEIPRVVGSGTTGRSPTRRRCPTGPHPRGRKGTRTSRFTRRNSSKPHSTLEEAGHVQHIDLANPQSPRRLQ